MAYTPPSKTELAVGIKAAKAAGIDGRDQVKWAVDMWRIHTGKDDKPKGWRDPYASMAKKPTAKAKKKAK